MAERDEDIQAVMDATDLLNELNETVGKKLRTLDCVVMASSLLLCSALRQLGDHGAQRARLIGADLERMVRDESAAMEKLIGVR